MLLAKTKKESTLPPEKGSQYAVQTSLKIDIGSDYIMRQTIALHTQAN